MLLKYCELIYQRFYIGNKGHFFKSGALKSGRQNHPLIFYLIKIPKWNKYILKEQKIWGVYDKIEHIESKRSRWKLGFKVACCENATAWRGEVNQYYFPDSSLRRTVQVWETDGGKIWIGLVEWPTEEVVNKNPITIDSH